MSNPCPSCNSGELKRIFSRRAGRSFWKCTCGMAFADIAGLPAEKPLRGKPNPSIRCPDCEAPMVECHGTANGNFYSCSAYPKCRGTLEIGEQGGMK